MYGILFGARQPCTDTCHIKMYYSTRLWWHLVHLYYTYKNPLKSYYATPTQSHLISWKIWFYYTWPTGHRAHTVRNVWPLDVGTLKRLPNLFLSFRGDACVIECYRDGQRSCDRPRYVITCNMLRVCITEISINQSTRFTVNFYSDDTRFEHISTTPSLNYIFQVNFLAFYFNCVYFWVIDRKCRYESEFSPSIFWSIT